jgi:hypothetical protein
LSQEAQQPVGDRQPSTRGAQLLIEVGLELASTPYFAGSRRMMSANRLYFSHAGASTRFPTTSASTVCFRG